jgi:hypothetical protein
VKKMGAKKVEVEKVIPNVRSSELEDDRRSQHSSRSNMSTYSAAAELKLIAVKVPRTIEELEHKIESLINQSIAVLKRQRSNIGLTKWAQIRKSSSLDQDFKAIEVYFNELKLQTEEN